MTNVIKFSKVYRQHKLSPMPHTEGGCVYNFKSCKKRVLAWRKQRVYAAQYTGHFVALEEECARMFNNVDRWGVCNSFPAGTAACKFLATGMLLRSITKKLEGSVPAVLDTTQKTGDQLRKAIQDIPMNRLGAEKDLYGRVSNILLLCQELRGALHPLLAATEASQPAHV